MRLTTLHKKHVAAIRLASHHFVAAWNEDFNCVSVSDRQVSSLSVPERDTTAEQRV